MGSTARQSCCCCRYCSGPTPNQLIVTLAEIDLCAGCWSVSNTYSMKWRDAPDIGPNGVFTLNKSTTNPCVWWCQTELTTGSLDQWAVGNTTCNGDPSDEITLGYYKVLVEKSAGTRRVFSWYAVNADLVSDYRPPVFEKTNVAAACGAEVFDPNEYACGPANTVGGEHGTATVELP